MKSKSLVVLLALVVVAAVIWGRQAYKAGRRNTVANVGYGQLPILYCENCAHMFKSPPDQLTPLPCPKCNQTTAFQAEFAQCNVCQTYLPMTLYQWPPDEKAKWDARLKLGSLSQTEYNDMYRARQGKRPSGEWVVNAQVSAQPVALRCPKCGNQARGQFYGYARPPVEVPAPKK